MTQEAPAAMALVMSPEWRMPPSAMTGMPAGLAALAGVEDGGDLRHADAGDDAGGADGAGTDADLDGVGAGVDEVAGAFGGGDVAGDDVIWMSMAFGFRTVSMTLRCGRGRYRRRRHRHLALAISTARSRSRRTPTAAPTRRRPRASLQARGYSSVLSMSLMVMRPWQVEVLDRRGGVFRRDVSCEDAFGLVEGGVGGGGDEVVLGHDLA